MIKNINDDILEAHEHSINNKRTLLLKNKKCGCFFCLKIFSPKEIKDWIDDDQTGLCPHCGIDAVIGESSGFPITKEFLEKMHEYWF
jgi:predicted  nucleic acid-binding Zn-ribbon protein